MSTSVSLGKPVYAGGVVVTSNPTNVGTGKATKRYVEEATPPPVRRNEMSSRTSGNVCWKEGPTRSIRYRLSPTSTMTTPGTRSPTVVAVNVNGCIAGTFSSSSTTNEKGGGGTKSWRCARIRPAGSLTKAGLQTHNPDAMASTGRAYRNNPLLFSQSMARLNATGCKADVRSSMDASSNEVSVGRDPSPNCRWS